MRYSVEDYAHGTPPRICGKESEITPSMKPGELLRLIDDMPALKGAVTVNNRQYWMRNGGELYLDMGEVIETASPEGCNGREVELHSRVGERMIHSLVEQYRTVVEPGDNPYGFIDASKRSGYVEVKNSAGIILMRPKSTGQHDNYYAPGLVKSEGYEEKNRRHDAIVSYLATRGTWAGTGIVAPDGYRTTQKFAASHFGSHGNKITHGAKIPYILHTEDGRVEFRTGDANMSSEVAITLLDFTSLVLRMVEHNAFPERLFVIDPNTVMRDSSVLGRLIQTRAGEMTGAEHQRLVAEAALAFASQQSDTPKNEIAAAEHVARVCNYIELYDGSMDTLELIIDDVEWAAKLWNIRKNLGNKAIRAENLDAVREDLRWEDISPDRSPSRKWYTSHGDPFTEAEILRAYTHPPRTRALARTAVLQAEQEITGVEWNLVTSPGKWFHMPDPFDDAIDPQMVRAS